MMIGWSTGWDLARTLEYEANMALLSDGPAVVLLCCKAEPLQPLAQPLFYRRTFSDPLKGLLLPVR